MPLLLMSSAAQSAQAERPPATELLPQSTFVYLAVADSQVLVERFKETSLGQMSQDPQMRPLVNQVYAALVEAAKPLEQRLGLTLTELLSLPQGEVAVALVAQNERPPAIVALIDTGEQARSVETLLDRSGRTLVEAGATQHVETVDGVDLTLYTLDGRRQRQIAFFQKDGTLAVSTDLAALEDLLAAWKGGQAATLSQNPDFAAIAKSVAGAAGEEPQVSWFVDPVNAVRALGQNSSQAQVGLALLPVLGLDGLKGLGGSLSFSTGQFDYINRAHVLLEEPRAGVVEMVALGTGEVVPESWAPAQTANYWTVYWNAQTTYGKLARLVNSFQGEGAFQRQAQQRLLDRSDVDLEREVLPALAGRFTYLTAIEEPITPRSQSQLIGIKLKDAAAFQATFDKVAASYQDVTVKGSFGGVAYVKYAPPELGEAPAAAGEAPQRPRPCFALVGDYLLIGRESLLEKAIVASQDSRKSLADALDFKLIASKAQRQAGGGLPSLFNFNRPEEGLRFMYGLATADSTRESLTRRGDNSPFLKNLNQALQQNPLPPLSTLEKYVAPGGAVLIDNETGWHYTSFTLRRAE